jgi:membrane protein DedA with SNARE-associated domain
VQALPGFRVLSPSKRPPRRFNVLAMENNTIAPARTVAPLLWVVLVISAGTNAVGSATGLDFTLRTIAGSVALVCTGLLITYYVRRRRAK